MHLFECYYSLQFWIYLFIFLSKHIPLSDLLPHFFLGIFLWTICMYLKCIERTLLCGLFSSLPSSVQLFLSHFEGITWDLWDGKWLNGQYLYIAILIYILNFCVMFFWSWHLCCKIYCSLVFLGAIRCLLFGNIYLSEKTCPVHSFYLRKFIHPLGWSWSSGNSFYNSGARFWRSYISYYWQLERYLVSKTFMRSWHHLEKFNLLTFSVYWYRYTRLCNEWIGGWKAVQPSC